MYFKRELKLFWAKYSNPILFWSIVFIVVIFIIQSLNAYVKNNNYQEDSNILQNEIENIITITEEEKIENEELIQKFIDFCKNKKLDQAYNLLSEECKKQLYPNLNSFTQKYYSRIFNKKRDIQFEIIDNETYKIMFYEDMLESGKIEGRNSLEDYCKIVQAIGENKLYINLKNTIK